MEKKCKNKKCGKMLPEGYKYKYCENCRNNHADAVKKAGKGILGVVGIAAGTAVTIVTKGKINPNHKA